MNLYESTFRGNSIKQKNLSLDLSSPDLNLHNSKDFSIELYDEIIITHDSDIYIDALTTENIKPNYNTINQTAFLIKIDELNIKTYSNDITIKDKIFIPHSNTTLVEEANTATTLEPKNLYKVTSGYDNAINQYTSDTLTGNNQYFYTDQLDNGIDPPDGVNVIRIKTGLVLNKSNKINFICSVLPKKLTKITGEVMFLDGNPIFVSDQHKLLMELVIKPQKKEDKKYYNVKPVPDKHKFPELADHLEHKPVDLPFFDNLYENINYFSYGQDKKVLVLKINPYNANSQEGHNDYRNQFHQDDINFSLELNDDLIIDEISDIYIDAVISMNTKLSTTTLSFVLNIDQFNIKNYSNNPILNDKILIPNETSSIAEPKRSYTHKNKKLNYVCDILPSKLNKITGSITDMSGNSIFNNSNSPLNLIIIEFLFIKQKP